jgi:2-polyprenyl-3-methyl-5-hydroxy-6-metoxy-1,4-benzoquinol methylase
MVHKAVYSFWQPKGVTINGGFAKRVQLAQTLALSLEYSKKQFEKTELVTNQEGYELLIEKYKLPFDTVKFLPPEFEDLNSDFWAYTKIYAYSIQEEPFIHIDTDVILFNKLNKEKLKAPLLFQNKEYFEDHKGYERLIDEALTFPKLDFSLFQNNPLFAYNCGIVGVNDLEVIKTWKKIVDEYLFNPRNKSTWDKIKDKHSHNHLYEQYYISAIIERDNIKAETLLKDDFYISTYRDKVGIVHLWGNYKRDQEIMGRIRTRLYKEFPKYIEIFEESETHSEIFEDIIKAESWGRGQGSGGGSSIQITKGYRVFLQKFLREKEIKSVLDLGCGDFQFSKLIDWSGINYLGFDCVSSLIETNNELYSEDNIKFELYDITKELTQSANLLIVKDVLIHWSNSEIKVFLEKLKGYNFKYVLITTQVETVNNRDIKTGEYHPIHLNQEPFNCNFEEIYNWESDNKTTFLIKK